MSESSYRFESIDLSESLLDSIVDATYVIHLTGNGREETMRQQLAKYPPSKRTYVLHNKGYMTGEKGPHVQSTSEDIVHANVHIFEHALQEGYGNILVLEDDFFFGEAIRSPEVVQDIVAFLHKLGKQPYLYSLGCLPFFALPAELDKAFCRHYFGPFLATHACLYSPAYRDDVLQRRNNLRRVDWEIVNPTCFFYHEPLCFQLFPATENRKKWGQQLIPAMYSLVQAGADWFVPFFALDTSIKGYYFLYFLAKWWILIVLVVYFVMSFLFSTCLHLVESVMFSVFSPLAYLLPSSNHVQVQVATPTTTKPHTIPPVRPFLDPSKPLLDYTSVKVNLPTEWLDTVLQTLQGDDTGPWDEDCFRI